MDLDKGITITGYICKQDETKLNPEYFIDEFIEWVESKKLYYGGVIREGWVEKDDTFMS